MLIINADDWGGNSTSTDKILICFKKDRITSTSAMVFMADSQRASELAFEIGLDTGLHINFTLKFDADFISKKLLERQQRIASFLRKSNYFPLFYNPLLKRDFEYVYNSQFEEYMRLYNKKPSHFDGHHHMHLCTNMLVDRLIPEGFKVRRTFTFVAGEKNIFNRFYRSIIDAILTRRYICTDYFFSISACLSIDRLVRIISMSKSWDVELMVHPERPEEFDYLMSDEYLQVISCTKRESYLFL